LLQRLGDLRHPRQAISHTDTFTDTSTVQDISEASPERLRARKATAGRIWAYRTRLMQTGADGLAVWRPQARSGLPGIIPYQDTFISASRRCGSSSSSSSSNLSAVSVSVPASSAVSVITVVTPTNQQTNLIPTPLGRYPRTACSLHSRYSTYTRYFLVGVTSVITVTVAGVWAGTEAAQRGWLPLRQQQQQRQWRSR